MKLSNLLLTAALFVSATIAFANPKVDMSNVSDFLTMERSESTNTLNIKMFRMNNGWEYYVNGYTQGTGENADPVLSHRSLLSKDEQYLISSDKSTIQEIIAGMENLPEDVRAGLNQHAIGLYEFSIPVTDDIIEIGLAGGNGNGAFVESVWQRSATNGNDFWTIGDSNIIYMGKGNLGRPVQQRRNVPHWRRTLRRSAAGSGRDAPHRSRLRRRPGDVPQPQAGESLNPIILTGEAVCRGFPIRMNLTES